MTKAVRVLYPHRGQETAIEPDAVMAPGSSALTEVEKYVGLLNLIG